MMLNATPELRINLHEFTKVSQLKLNKFKNVPDIFDLRFHSSMTSA